MEGATDASVAASLPQCLEEAVAALRTASPDVRFVFFRELVSACSARELSLIDTLIQPRLAVDFLGRLPSELALYVLSFLDTPQDIIHAASVSRAWRNLTQDEHLWRSLCVRHRFNTRAHLHWLVLGTERVSYAPPTTPELFPAETGRKRRHRSPAWPQSPSYLPKASKQARVSGAYALDALGDALPDAPVGISFRSYFELAYMVQRSWLRQGRLLVRQESCDLADADPHPDRRLALTCCALHEDWIVIGATNASIYVLSARTGEHIHTLKGHRIGVWCIAIAGGSRAAGPVARTDPQELIQTSRDRRPGRRIKSAPMRESLDDFFSAGSDDATPLYTRGWGNEDAYLVSAGSDRSLRVWNLRTGYVFLLTANASMSYVDTNQQSGVCSCWMVCQRPCLAPVMARCAYGICRTAPVARCSQVTKIPFAVSQPLAGALSAAATTSPAGYGTWTLANVNTC